MKSKTKYKSISALSFFIVTVYFLLNTALVIEWLNMQGTLSVFATAVFTVDCFTWHIYGVIAIVGFILRTFTDDYKSHSARSKTYIVLHFVFMIVSFFEIFHMMQNAF